MIHTEPKNTDTDRMLPFGIDKFPDLDSVTVTEDGYITEYVGVGGTYLRFSANQARMRIPAYPAGLVLPDNYDPEQTGEQPILKDILATAQLYSGGCLLGGFSEDHQPIFRGKELTQDEFMQIFTSLIDGGLGSTTKVNTKELFTPNMPNFDFRDQIVKPPQEVVDILAERVKAVGPLTSDATFDIQIDDELAIDRAKEIARIIQPKFKLQTLGGSFEFSASFNIVSDYRDFIALYHDGSSLPTLYYQSQSHGCWRALLARNANNHVWYAKCFFMDENSADAPAELQSAFSNRGISSDNRIQDEFLEYLVPTSDKKLDRDEQKSQARKAGESQLEEAGIDWFSSVCTSQHRNSKSFNVGNEPDMLNPIDSWQIHNNSLYRNLSATVYQSVNGNVRYVINESVNESGRSQKWVSTAEIVDAKVSYLGLKIKYPELPDFATKPPIDYEYRDSGDTIGYGERLSADTEFDKYLRNLPARNIGPT